MNPPAPEDRRFVTAAEKVDVLSPWTLEEWLSRSDVVPNREILMVRANMEAGRCHPFHTHPTREELIYILSGRAEQWINGEYRVLGPGEMVLIQKGEVHGTYNPYRERLVFLAILSPADAPEPGIVDVSTQEPWASIRASRGLPACT
ncbi:MAG: cupin domain-containing protein [Verrucomicrobiales bacterium]|nr:cupin domain-containing protein [Verrucomicrobiales bacterium]